MKLTTLQFGTGRFLRCFVDLFAHELNESGSPAGRIVAIQSTGSDRAARINALNGRFHAGIRGLLDGRLVDRTVEVASLARALAAADDWDGVVAAARGDSLRCVVSNTTEAGLTLAPQDAQPGGRPISFPARMLDLLLARYQASLPPLAVLPCELVDRNAARLRDLVLEQANRLQLETGAVEWIRDACSWHNTLVDRIVSAPKGDDPLAASDPLFAVAEPFALWLVEGSFKDLPFSDHPSVAFVDRLEPYHLRKVRILNGAHTALVAKAQPMGIETVREAIGHAAIRPWLESLLFEEIVPTLEDRVDDAESFARAVLERFANPFLDHRLADIAVHQEVKVETRLRPTWEEYRERFGTTPRIRALVG